MAAASIADTPPISVTSRSDGAVAAALSSASSALDEATYLRWTVRAVTEVQVAKRGARYCASQRCSTCSGVFPNVTRSAVLCVSRVARTCVAAVMCRGLGDEPGCMEEPLNAGQRCSNPPDKEARVVWPG